jgi:ribonuclease D
LTCRAGEGKDSLESGFCCLFIDEASCPGGGIGRRAGFRCQWPQGRGSSSLLLGTIFFVIAVEFWGAVQVTLKNAKDATIDVHQGDISAGVEFCDAIAVDTEAMGLNNHRDRLCVVQLSSGDGTAHLVKFDADDNYSAPNLKALLVDKSKTKIFHYARFDVAIIRQYLDVVCQPIYCTKIASYLARTYTNGHGLKDLCKELLGIELSKAQQSSDWGNDKLSDEQIVYAASDVLHLHQIRTMLDEMLLREGRTEYLEACLNFMPTRTALDLDGWAELDIFHH